MAATPFAILKSKSRNFDCPFVRLIHETSQHIASRKNDRMTKMTGLCSADPYLVVDAALWIGDGHVASGIAPGCRYDDGDLLQVDLLAQRLVQDPRGVSQHLLRIEINKWLKVLIARDVLVHFYKNLANYVYFSVTTGNQEVVKKTLAS